MLIVTAGVIPNIVAMMFVMIWSRDLIGKTLLLSSVADTNNQKLVSKDITISSL